MKKLFSLLTLFFLLAPPSFAQRPNPNQDRLPQPLPNPEEVLPPETDEPLTPPTPPAVDIPNGEATLPVTTIDVVGSTVFTAADFALLTAPLENRDVSLNELQALTNAITQLYFEQGYLTSRAVLLEQEIVDGQVTVQVIEGTISDIQIEGNEQTRDEYLRPRIALGTGTPIQLEGIENQLRLLQLDPLFESVEGTLLPGDEAGESVLAVAVEEAKLIDVDFFIDNYSPPSVGDVRTGISLSYRNFNGWGDQLNLGYTRSTSGGTNLYDFGYRIPLNAREGSLQLRSLISDSEQTQTALDVSGSSEFYEANYRQPIIRTPQEELALSVGFAYREGQTFLFDSPFPFGIGPEDDGTSRTSVIKFGQDYISRDVSGAWAFQSQFSLGTGMFNATENEGDVPDGQFFSWLGQGQRVQRLDENNLLVVNASAQLSPNNLLASEQFVIGGGQSVRGYRQNVRSGDNGFRLSVEDRVTVTWDKEVPYSTFQVIPFVDMGYVWNQPNNPNPQSSERFLLSAGMGINYELLEGLTLDANYGLPLVGLSDRTQNIQDDGFHFRLNYHY